MRMLAPDDLLQEVNHFDLRVFAASDATCNGPTVALQGNASPVATQAGITNQSATINVPSGPRVFAVDGFADQAGSARIAQGCTAATLEPSVPAMVTIKLVRVGGPPPRVVYASNVNGFGMTALFIDDTMGGAPRQVTMTPVYASGSDYDFAGGSVVFSGVSSNVSLYTASVDGAGGDTQLPFAGGADTGPVYSPDGLKIAFVSTRTGSRQVFVIDLSAMGETQISPGPGDAVAPGWSSDSQQLAWVALAPAAKVMVGKPNAMGGKALSTPAPAQFAQPVWTTDGKILVAVASAGKDDLVEWDPASDLRVTTLASLGNVRHPSLAPDGSVLLFVADGAMGDGDVYKFDFKANGTKLSPLFSTSADEDWPAWAPAQNEIAFTVNSKVEVAAPDGTGAKRLTTSTATEVHPLFAPVK